MDPGLQNMLAYAGYLSWIAAGMADFALHRRSDLPHTSGLAESRLHLLQLVVVGTGLFIWWALAPNWGAWSLAAACVVLHAFFGYADTRSAWHRRDIVPLEQHIHSVLDFAPWLFLAWYASQIDVPGAALRWQPRPWSVWLWLGIPAAGAGLMALKEFHAAWRVARTPAKVR